MRRVAGAITKCPANILIPSLNQGASMIAKERTALILYFILAFAITWTSQIVGMNLAQANGLLLSNEDNFGHFLALFSGDVRLPYLVFTSGAGPLLAALIVLAIFEGQAGIKKLFMQMSFSRLSIRWLVIAILLPIAVSLVSLLFGVLANGLKPLQSSPKLPLAYFIPFLLYMIIFTGFWEEPGWRGFALPRLQKYYNAETSSWILGVLWGAWHIPVNLYLNWSAGPAVLIPIIIGLLLGTVGWTIVNTWVYNNTRSLLLMILLHGWTNTVQSYLVLSTANMTAMTLFAILPWALAIYLTNKYGKENLSPSLRPQY
jgi:membrane protease YdiL (CAAX protease family)